MSEQIIASELFFELVDEQLELLAGGADFELSNTNYAERVITSLESTASSFVGNNRFAVDVDKAINTAAQNLLGFGGAIPEIMTLPPPPIL
ncbi:CTB family bacteriocin [Cronbergia sp. UHCC 0137]|uniref:CTB family bacteriocin n=1 Tax=Cronbergia sp. UHCC 0137 TaxID=3110239 RepID=UPI002B2027DC|nr:CTB family bacteriocin [Cronbergia sp. UHCC 0137]MEA5618586.1 CTB family bacteriocin [Cronbergia sp. UHCC 0137]